jgi:hypothetical protein
VFSGPSEFIHELIAHRRREAVARPRHVTTVGIDLLSALIRKTAPHLQLGQTLASKQDARGSLFTYQYDSYKRLTKIFLGGNLLRTFVYDTNTLDTHFLENFTQGRLVAVQKARDRSAERRRSLLQEPVEVKKPIFVTVL